MFQRLILRDTFAAWATVRVRVVAAELLEWLALWADVLIVLGVPFKVGTRPCAVGAAGFIQNWDMWFDLTFYDPVEHGARAICGVCDEPFGVEFELIPDATD